MTPGLLKMTISLIGILLMVLASVIIYFTREKLQGVPRWIGTIIAYLFMAVSFVIMILIVFDYSSVK
ncbi:DUF2768 family protein [Massilibacterium senegalense]|uniref:DUF2768 family protein n=1 Tax=Massilibacterium senegalense TaxID=1632858 RepID=UPI00078328CE|nr:DUF2768 family protein [Massilibacterium senegalense]